MGPEVAYENQVCPNCRGVLPGDAAFCNQCGASVAALAKTGNMPVVAAPARMAAQHTADPLIGAVVADRYRIESMIGRGGMGVVYKVEHAKIGKIMALKLLTGALARNEETVRRFKREALMVSKLSHPNTVQVFDFGSVGGLTYLAMEYLSGRDLADLVERQGPLPFPQLAKIALQACGSLKEAHEHGMVHRDIKPENLFLTRTPSGDDLVKVLDFGLAKLRDTSEAGNITMTGNIVGTPYYMAPEQVRGEEVDGRADIYSLCALMYTCLTGSFLFDGPSPLAILTAQLSDAPVPPHLRAPDKDIAPSVSALLLRGLEKSPSKRYQTVEELEEAIRLEVRAPSQVNLHLPESGTFIKPPIGETATRSEVEQYEQTLRRREQAARWGGFLVLTGALALLAHFYIQSLQPAPFVGRELEPNHEVTDATPIPFGTKVSGQLGRRISKERGDQDNYLVAVPTTEGPRRTTIALTLTAPPNMAVCLYLFPRGAETPLAQYCTGAPGRAIRLPRLALKPGQYLVAVKQDVNSYEKDHTPLIYENVSDDYSLHLAPADDLNAWELEPNDNSAAANWVALDKTPSVSGTLTTMRDKDVVCASGSGYGRFVVFDGEAGRRLVRAVLSATPIGGPQDQIPVRIHHTDTQTPTSERDQRSPLRGPVLDLASSPCVELTLVPNPWAPTPHPLVAPASETEWRVELQRAEPPLPTP